MQTRKRVFLAAHVLTATLAAADLPPSSYFTPLPTNLKILAPCVPHTPWTVAGEHGALLGRQDGTFEAWSWPVKLLSNFRIWATLNDYPVPIDVNALAAEISVTPAETVITYSHAAFTVRQRMFASKAQTNPAASIAVLFEIESSRGLKLTFSFTPEMLRMWPASNFGRPDGEWISKDGMGAYILHTDNPKFSGLVAMPNAEPGILVPYQEHPQTYPLQFQLAFDPKLHSSVTVPLIMAIGSEKDAIAQANEINAALPQLYAETQNYYAHFFDNRLVVHSPDEHLNQAASWAELAVDDMQVRTGKETGMVAGYFESADSARPGYAWFFGRDTLWTTYAINSYGDFALTRTALDFLIHRQRADGKIMHEYSQMAGQLDWTTTPYFYASADATPLLIMAMWDYVRSSNDTAYLKQQWEAIRKAYAFMQGHDTDGDGIYDNSEGSGWVESWPPTMPHQEIYLAALDEQAADAMSHLATLMADASLAANAHSSAGKIKAAVESEYYEPARQFYAFSHNADGTRDSTATIYPAVAWWDGTFALQNAGPMLSRWASDEFSADWGTRDISQNTSFYDPISYHQGSIWPLFTGWVSLAEYRAGRSLSGYAHLMQNANLTWSQDLGSVTELLSGEFFQPLGRSTSHQMWSSAVVLTSVLRGLFGLDWDAPNSTLHVTPQIPAAWDGAELHHLHLGSLLLDLAFKREGDGMQISARTQQPEHFCLDGKPTLDTPCNNAATVTTRTITVPLKPVELTIDPALPQEGARTSQLKVLDEQYSTHGATFILAAPGGSDAIIPVRLNRARVSVKNAQLANNQLRVHFPEKPAYQHLTISFSW